MQYSFYNIRNIIILFICSLLLSNCSKKIPAFENSIGMKMILVPEGSFLMGELNEISPEIFDIPQYLKNGDWDEKPVHQVTISNSFYISETEVTIAQYKKFRPDYEGVGEYHPYASGVSWNEAQKFCEWLSEKEGKTYRLPTESEWEYACRAGTTSPFSTGDTLSLSDSSNRWGIKNLHTHLSEWCLDWHGLYTAHDQVDPVGPANGIAKVVRGGGLDRNTVYYARSVNRAGMPPDFPPLESVRMKAKLFEKQAGIEEEKKSTKPEKFKSRFYYKNFIRDKLNNQGNHSIGFRLVQALYPDTEPTIPYRSFAQECIKQNTTQADSGPDPQKPYFRKRNLLPTPPENTPVDQLSNISFLGFHPAILRHHHSPALEVCPNGDILAIYYTSVSETNPDVAMIASRLRFGADEWDMPDLFIDVPDVNDHAPMLWNDAGTLYFFWGHNKLSSGFPFQWMTSADNGQSWSPVHFPVFETLVAGHSAQPVNSAIRDNAGSLYISSDGVGPESVLWVSHNNGQTWIDTGGRTGGRHTTFALLKDGRLLGMGGKSSDIEGFMPQSISDDGGKTWKISRTVFPSLGSNQRPTLIRLQSGRLFFAGDLQHRSGNQPKGYSERGCYVALSEDEGKHWHIKKLPGAQEHEDPERRKDLKGSTLGYAVARQAPNGIIHLITSMNEPNLHFAFNETWILQKEEVEKSETDLTLPKTKNINNVREYKETYSGGEVKAIWSAGIGDDGRYLLHGDQIFYYANGQKQWQVKYQRGQKTGNESYWSIDGKQVWSWEHAGEDKSKWTHWWDNDHKRSESNWVNKKSNGIARYWDRSGKLVKEIVFREGLQSE